MTIENLIGVPLPGIFTGRELMDEFRKACSFQQDDDTKWEYGEERFSPGVRWGDNRYLRVFALPLFRTHPNQFQRRVLGQKEKWTPRDRSLAIAGSQVAIFLTTFENDYEVCEQTYSIRVWMGANVDLGEAGMHVHINNVDHPGFRRYRASFERIRANFLTNMVNLAKIDARVQNERQMEGVEYYQNKLVGSDELV